MELKMIRVKKKSNKGKEYECEVLFTALEQ